MNKKLINIKYRLAPIILKSFFIISGIGIISSFIVILGMILILLDQSHLKSNELNDVFIGKQRYTMIDDFYDPDEFYKFRQNYNNINLLAEFYNKLIQSDKIKVLSIFNQPLQIKDYKGDRKCYYNSNEFIEQHKNVDIAVKSIQLNKSVFDFYNIKIKSGIINWDNISYSDNSIPILLGSTYKNLYNIGESILGNYYGKVMKFEVVGFLKENSFLYYQNNPEFYLDDYIIIPYPKELWIVDNYNFEFESILYFALVNCDLITSTNERSFIDEVKRIANTVGYKNFSIVGVDDFQIKYASLISVVKENLNNLIIIFILSYILVVFILYGFGKIIVSTQFMYYQLYWIIGDKTYKRLFLTDISSSYIISFLIGIIFQLYYFEVIYLKVIIIQFLILISIFSFVFYLCNKSLLKKLIK
jgi:hypothetical protein